MRSLIKPTCCALLALLALVCMSFREPEINGRTITSFRLKNTDGKMVSLSDYPAAKGFIVVFTCNHCPFAKVYPQRLNELAKRYRPKGIPLLAISSGDTTGFEEDSYPNMVRYAKQKGLSFPYLYDPLQTVGRQFGAERTPHAFVIWKEHGCWKIKYNGAIDDNGAEPDKVKNHFLADAVDALLAGREPALPQTRSVGCTINYR